MANFCEKCGSALNPGSSFCPQCGAKVIRTGKSQNKKGGLSSGKASIAETSDSVSVKRKDSRTTGGMLSKLIILILAAAVGFTGFVKPGFFLKDRKDPDHGTSYASSGDSGSPSSSSSVPHIVDTGKLSPDADRVTLTVSDCLIEGEAEYTVAASNIKEDKNKGIKVYTYDISSEQITGPLNGFMEIRIPYDESYFEPGEDPRDCLGVYVIDDDGSRDPELYDVDVQNGEVIVYTEHLSKRELYHYSNAKTAVKYEVNFGNTFAGNLSFKECASILTDFFDSYAEMSEAEKSYYFNEEAIRLIIGSLLKGTLRIFPEGVNNYLNDTSSWITNASTMLALGGEYEQAWISGSMGALSKLGLYTSMCKFSYAFSNLASPWNVNGPSREEVINLYKTGFNTALDYLSSAFGTGSVAANVAMSMSGIFVFALLIDSMFEEAMYQKMWDMAAVYEYFGDSYKGGKYSPRTNMEWYNIFLDIVERYVAAGKQEFVEEAINREIHLYAMRFWNLDGDTVNEVISAAGYKRMPWPTESEQETMTEAYEENLRYRLHPIILQCERTMLKRAEQRAQNWLRKAYNRLNYKVPLEIADGNEKKIYGGYWFRFAGLSETADLSIFQGQLNKDGIFDTSFCMNDWMQAGVPVHVNLYATRDDMEKEKNIVATAQMIPAKTAKETTFVKFYEGTDELVWVMDQQVFRSKWDNYDSCPLTQKDVCQNQPGCTYIQIPCFEKKTECEDGLCTVHTDNYGMYNDPNAVTNTEEDSFRIPPRIISDAADPSIYPGYDMLYFKKGTSEETYRIFITGGKENESFGSKLTDVIPLKEQGAYFIFSCKVGQYACRYRCVSVKEAENMKIEHIDALGREFYGIKY